ncbi:MAG: SpoIID/LytB domain-containing protein [Oscillospiraceae bacterium]|nr:SpoIID/LytB domain-containing protein [Oscillospiraceae bacterium]
MKKGWTTVFLSLLLACFLSTGARAMEHDMLKVGLKYGSDAMYSANLQNYDNAGRGYAFGYYDSARSFVPLTATTESKISVSIDDNLFISGSSYYLSAATYSQYIGAYHLQLMQSYETYEEAAAVAANYDGGFVAFLIDRYAVRVNQYRTEEGVNRAFGEWAGADTVEIVSPSRTGVMVTVTGTDHILFYFDCGGLRSLGVQPLSADGEKPVTWFRGYRYYGGFEYQRVTGGNMNVINVVNIEDYTKGCVGWEIGNDKPLEAIKAQAVCARTYAAMQTRHRSQGFDVCSTDDCQVYRGVASANDLTDRAVDETAGKYLYYNGKYAEAYYYSCNGGASEDAKNVWGNELGYLKGKPDPYEAAVAPRIAKYNWSTTFTRAEIASKLAARSINIGTIKNVFVSEYTPNGNVYALTFVGSDGNKTVYREQCRTILGLRSMRFSVGSTEGDTYFVNDNATSVTGIQSLFTISGNGVVGQYSGSPADAYVITSGGTAKLQKDPSIVAADQEIFTVTGSGWGHNVGMSQWGATAMAEMGFDYQDILQFYYTGVTIE